MALGMMLNIYGFEVLKFRSSEVLEYRQNKTKEVFYSVLVVFE